MTPEERKHATYICRYPYHDSDGTELFFKKRYALDPPLNGRTKTFTLHYRPTQGGDPRPGLPRGHPGRVLLFRVPELLSALSSRRGLEPGPAVYLPEGEKDVETLRDHGLVATTYWQGAEVGISRAQSVWLQNAPRLVVVADRDSAGAYSAWRTYRLLVEHVTPFYGVTVVRARGAGNKDATDHFAAGHGVEDFKPVNMKKLARVAAAHRLQRLGGTRY